MARDIIPIFKLSINFSYHTPPSLERNVVESSLNTSLLNILYGRRIENTISKREDGIDWLFGLLLAAWMDWLKNGYKEEIDGYIKERLRSFMGQGCVRSLRITLDPSVRLVSFQDIKRTFSTVLGVLDMDNFFTVTSVSHQPSRYQANTWEWEKHAGNIFASNSQEVVVSCISLHWVPDQSNRYYAKTTLFY